MGTANSLQMRAASWSSAMDSGRTTSCGERCNKPPKSHAHTSRRVGSELAREPSSRVRNRGKAVAELAAGRVSRRQGRGRALHDRWYGLGGERNGLRAHRSGRRALAPRRGEYARWLAVFGRPHVIERARRGRLNACPSARPMRDSALLYSISGSGGGKDPG